MLMKLLPVVLAAIGLAAGAGAGLLMRPAPAPAAATAGGADGDSGHGAAMAKPGQGAAAGAGQDAASPAHDDGAATEVANTDYVKLNNQFIVPIVKTGKVRALVILSLSIAIADSAQSKVYNAEPKLRDAFLQVLFDHANAGGFDGNFTLESKMTALRDALREVAVKILGDSVRDVLISDLVRQDA